MIQQALQELQNLTLRTVDKPLIEGVTYANGKSYQHKVSVSEHGRRLGDVIEPFRPAKLEVSTLTGFVDAVKAMVGGSSTDNIIHVEDYLTVAVKSSKCDDFGKRDTLLLAKYQPLEAFVFGRYYTDPQEFIIAFQVAFHLNDPDGAYLLKLASNLTAVASVQATDDGINQSVIAKVGEIKTAEITIRPRVKLLPRTTFDEAAPVEREFLIRLKQISAGAPAISIHAVDGNKWKGENMRAIQTYLGAQLPGWNILA